VRRYVEAKYGADALYNQGLQIYTAVNIDFQKMAEQAVNKDCESSTSAKVFVDR